MLVGILLVALALGADDLGVGASVRVPSVEIPGPLAISLGPTVATVVRRGERRLGVVLAGAGTAAITFADRGDALALADRQVLWFGVPKAEMAPVAHLGAPYRDAVRHVVLWTRDEAWVDALLAGGEPAEAPADALGIARSRLALAEGNSGRIPSDPATEFLYVDAELTRRLGYARPKAPTGGGSAVGLTGTAAEDAWATYVLEAGVSQDVVALYALAGEVVSRPIALPAWVEPARAAGGTLRLEVTGSEITATTRISGSQVLVEATTTTTVRCNAAAKHVDLHGVGTGDAHRTTAVTVDGAEVDPAAAKGGRLRLVGPWEAGAEIRITVADRYALLTPTRDAVAFQAVGHPVAGAGPAPYRVRVTLAPGLDAAVSGFTTGAAAELVSEGTGPAWLTLGRWASVVAPATGGFPQIRAHVDPAEEVKAASFGPFVRTTLAYFQQLLPALPSRELDLVQWPDDLAQIRWTSIPELITIQQMLTTGEGTLRALLPHLEEGVLAHEVAHQWWGGEVDVRLVEDRWLVETLAETYSCLFLSAAFGPEDCAIRENHWRAAWETSAPASEASPRRAWGTSAWRDVAYGYGPYVMLRMLRPQVGDEALFGALDAFARRYAGTGDASVYALESGLEAASGQDLGHFFDYWLDAGFVPAVSVAWDASGVDVTADVPFGTFELPIRVTGPDGEATVTVRVVDGEGSAAFASPARSITVDPDHRVLRTATRVRKRAAAR